MKNLALRSHDLSSNWYTQGSTTINSATSATMSATYDAGLFQVKATAVGAAYTAAFILSGTPGQHVYIGIQEEGGAYLQSASLVTLAATPTLYSVARPSVGYASALIRVFSAGSAVTVGFHGAGFFAGSLTSAQILAEGGIPTTTTSAASNPNAGKYWLEFDGGDSLLTGNLGITDACTIVIAGRLDSFTTTPKLLSESATGVEFRVDITGAISLHKAGIVQIISSSTGAIVAGTPFVITARLSGGTAVIRKNGVEIATTAYAGSFAATTGSRIGGDFFGAGNFATGTLGQIFAMPYGLTDAECLVIERYAASAFPGMTPF